MDISVEQIEAQAENAALEESGQLPRIPVVYDIGLGKCLDFSKDFESFARAPARPALFQAGTCLAERFRHNWQQRPQLKKPLVLYPIIPAYGEHICQEYPQVAKILEMLIGKRLKPLIKNLKPLLDPKRNWQRASALVIAMQALLQSGEFRDKDYDINNWELSDGPKTRYSFEREEFNPLYDARLHADPSMMSEGKLRQAIVFLQKHLEEAPREQAEYGKEHGEALQRFWGRQGGGLCCLLGVLLGVKKKGRSCGRCVK